MKKNTVISIGLFIAQSVCLTTSHAADTSVINITANIVASPCTISTPTLNIDLGDIQAAELATPGSASSWSNVYDIELTNCPASTTSYVATFTGTPATNGDTNGYKNTGAGGDGSISVELANCVEPRSYFSNGKTASSNSFNNHQAKIEVCARLYSSGTALPGAVASTINVGFEFK